MDEETGTCHMCQRIESITYCSICEHWFCEDCRTRWFWRGLEAMKQLITGKYPGCCGP